QGTTRNCAGGATPWGTWLSGEETDIEDIHWEGAKYKLGPKSNVRGGMIWETYPLEKGRPAEARPAMGIFRHEAAAYSPEGSTGIIYMTEDRDKFQPQNPNDYACFYRFIPDRAGDLSSGTLQVAVVSSENKVKWEKI